MGVDGNGKGMTLVIYRKRQTNVFSYWMKFHGFLLKPGIVRLSAQAGGDQPRRYSIDGGSSVGAAVPPPPIRACRRSERSGGVHPRQPGHAEGPSVVAGFTPASPGMLKVRV